MTELFRIKPDSFFIAHGARLCKGFWMCVHVRLHSPLQLGQGIFISSSQVVSSLKHRVDKMHNLLRAAVNVATVKALALVMNGL